MKFWLTFFLSFAFTVPDLQVIRENYPKAIDNKEIAASMHQELQSVTNNSNAALIAYQGAITVLMAKFAKGGKEKKAFFKEGISRIEYAITKSPANIEVRLIRLSVQENTPKFLKYQTSIVEDKQFILAHYGDTKSTAVKDFIKGYVGQSHIFSEDEKKLLQ